MSGVQRFPSRVDVWLVVVIVAAFLAAPIIIIAEHLAEGRSLQLAPIATMLAILVLTSAPMVWLFRTTDYTVTDSELVVRSGPLRWVVPLASIREIRASRSVLSAPALSLHRIEVLYGRQDSVVISPEDRRGFVLALSERVPSIVVSGINLDT